MTVPFDKPANNEPTNSAIDVDTNTSNDTDTKDSSDTLIVKCPENMSVFKSADGSFPDITPQGTEMTKGQAALAKEAAAAMWMKLKTNRSDK